VVSAERRGSPVSLICVFDLSCVQAGSSVHYQYNQEGKIWEKKQHQGREHGRSNYDTPFKNLQKSRTQATAIPKTGSQLVGHKGLEFEVSGSEEAFTDAPSSTERLACCDNFSAAT
jgi:hypothetical protein